MPRQLRIEYPGAMYCVMNRGDRREPIYQDDADRTRFLQTLGEACRKTDWQIHAYCLARRLRAETSVTLKWIAEHLHMGTWTHVANRLSHHPAQPDHQPDLNLCQK